MGVAEAKAPPVPGPASQIAHAEAHMSFMIYIVGFVILIVGLALAANMIGLSSTWIGIGVIVLVGIGVVTGATRTRRPDPPSS